MTAGIRFLLAFCCFLYYIVRTTSFCFGQCWISCDICRMKIHAIILFLSGLLIGLTIQAQDTVFGISLGGGSNGNGIYQFQQNTPNNLTWINNIDNSFYQSSDFSSDSIWYVTDYDRNLWTVNSLTGQAVFRGSMDVTLTGLTHSPTLQKLYGCSLQNFYEVNTDNGETSLIAYLSDSLNLFSMAADVFGNLYAIDDINDFLYRIDPLDGALMEVGALGLDVAYGFDMAINRNDGSAIFSAYLAEDLGTPILFDLDLSTGQATVLGAMQDMAQMTALAMPYELPLNDSIQGIITSNGEAVVGALVTVTAVGGNQSTTVVTDENGLYVFPVVYLGECTIEVVTDNHLSQSTSLFVNETGLIQQDFDLILSDINFIFQVIDNEAFEPIENASIVVNNDTFLSDVDGIVTFDNIAPNIYPFEAFKEGFYPQNGNIYVSDTTNLQGVVLVKDVDIARNVVIVEETTGTWCLVCPAASNGCDEMVENELPVAVVAYHIDDPFETPDTKERIQEFYGVTSLPHTLFDGTDPYPSGGGATASTYEPYLVLFNDKIDRKTPIDFSFENSFFDAENLTFTSDIQLEVFGQTFGEDYVFHAVLTESHIPEEWQGLSELNFAVRTMFNGAAGTNVDLSTMGTTLTIPIEFTFEEDWNIDHCKIVVFVQEINTHEILNGKQVENIAAFDTPTDTMNTTIENLKSPQIVVYPNPVKDILQLSFPSAITQIYVRYVQGNIVLAINDFDKMPMGIEVDFLSNGVYFIEFVDYQKQSFYRKFIKGSE